ncbi:hypothetical protein VP01_4000g3, partial [Puccinia sorghi]
CYTTTAMRTRFGRFEYTVMPFGLCNAPFIFQHFVSDIFADLVEVYVVVYLDDILVYSKTLENHCEFHNSSLQFLGVIVSSEGISMDPGKCQKVLLIFIVNLLKTIQRPSSTSPPFFKKILLSYLLNKP